MAISAVAPLYSDHSHRSADQCPETPPEHQELSVADALRTSVVTGNYLQINSPWPPATRSPIGKKIAFVQCAAERRRYFLCIQHGAQESNISP